MHTLHVEPRGNVWIVRREATPTPLSEHPDAGTAMLAAHARAAEISDAQVLIHDRYHRVHLQPPARRA